MCFAGPSLPISFRIDSSRFGMTPTDLTNFASGFGHCYRDRLRMDIQPDKEYFRH